MTAQLIVSLSGINSSTLHLGDGLAGELGARGVSLSLLFAPRVGGVEQPGDVLGWVREQQAAGHALVQHGYDDAAGRTEFRTLPGHEAKLRLTAAAATMERFGLTTDTFVPPRWVASSGTLLALRHRGFRLCADLLGVRDLRTDTVRRGRLQGFGWRLRGGVQWRTEPWWCFALVMGAARAARRGQLVRLAVDTADLARSGPRQALLDAVDIALHHGARPVTYPGLGAVAA